MTPERERDTREPDELDSLIDEFGDRAGPDPAREPEVDLGDDAEPGEGPPDGEDDPAGS